MKRWITAVGLVVLGASLAVAQQDAPPREHRGGPPREFVQMFATPLALTDAQKAQITAIEKKTREDNAAAFENARKTMDEFRAAREANDTARMESLKPVMDSTRAQMKSIRDAEMVKIAATLTADQKAKLDKLRAEHEAGGHPRSE